MIKLIDEQKRIIRFLQSKIKKREDDESNKKIIVAEKEQEILFLKNFINSLKHDSSSNLHF
jgi:hypothetical protein